MTPYLDTSAMIRACRMDVAPRGVTRTHTLAEFYSTLTGVGVLTVIGGREVKERLSPKAAAKEIRRTFAHVKFYDMGPDLVMEALERAAKKNVHGRNIHDWLHCLAAEKSKCDVIVTLNFSDFSLMTDLPLVNPRKQFA